MKKIPTIFERDWDGDRSRVTREPHPDCGWVFDGEGVATRKYDGTCVMIIYGEGGLEYFKRHEVREGKPTPEMFRQVEADAETSKIIGWVPVGDGPEDKWHRMGLAYSLIKWVLPSGTYELVGPKIQGNPDKFEHHQLVNHAQAERYIVPRTYDEIESLLGELDVEGFVFHHPDGRMAKIKKRDFGLKR